MEVIEGGGQKPIPIRDMLPIETCTFNGRNFVSTDDLLILILSGKTTLKNLENLCMLIKRATTKTTGIIDPNIPPDPSTPPTAC